MFHFVPLGRHAGAVPRQPPRGAGIQESLILRCPQGASKDEAGVPALDACKEQCCGVSFEASPCGLRTSG
ncbi:hypothetical protein ELG77_00645 [Rhizobium leguminosarum]|nr:hypothetical protein ELG77_00645 [Rhizobium leguminosarum]TBH61976.1 hypothetical protein ELG65_00645 [Rhizobium leguminosarum]